MQYLLTKQTVNTQETTLADGEGRGCDLLCNLQGPRISKLTCVWMIIKNMVAETVFHQRFNYLAMPLESSPQVCNSNDVRHMGSYHPRVS